MRLNPASGALFATIALVLVGAAPASSGWRDDCSDLGREQTVVPGVSVRVDPPCSVLSESEGDACALASAACNSLEAAYEEVRVKPIRCEVARAHADATSAPLALLAGLAEGTALAGISDEAAKGNLSVNGAVCPA